MKKLSLGLIFTWFALSAMAQVEQVDSVEIMNEISDSLFIEKQNK